MAAKFSEKVFDYRALRLMVGLIALFLPIFVSILASRPLSSISASYHTNARDLFVGMLFIVSTFLFAYNGHTNTEAWASKVAALAAVMVALCPVSCDNCLINLDTCLHCLAAMTLFSIMVFFCFGPFRKNTKGQGGKRGRRSRIYLVCGWTMLVCMGILLLLFLLMPFHTLLRMKLIYWGETIALAAFGTAWIVAGKYFRFLVDKADAWSLFR